MRLFVCFFLVEDIAAVYPDFHTDDAVRKVCLLAREVDICAKRLQRHAAALDFFGARHFRAAQAAGNANAHAQNVAIGHHLFHGLVEHAAERLALLQAFGDHIGDHGGLRFRATDLFNIEADSHFRGALHGADDFLNLFGELGASLSAATDDEARARGLDENADCFLIAFDFRRGDIVAAQTLFEEAADGGIYHHVGAIFGRRLRKPAALPVADDAEAMCVWMYGVCHKNRD